MFNESLNQTTFFVTRTPTKKIYYETNHYVLKSSIVVSASKQNPFFQFPKIVLLEVWGRERIAVVTAAAAVEYSKEIEVEMFKFLSI